MPVAMVAFWDHPRVRGEKAFWHHPAGRQLGSPPRARGEDADGPMSGLRKGITPACAGRR